MNRHPAIIVLIVVLAGVILFLGSAQPTTVFSVLVFS